jgi:hypothetical protein
VSFDGHLSFTKGILLQRICIPLRMSNLYVHLEQMLCVRPQCGFWLLDVEGPIEVARQGSEIGADIDEWKINQVLGWYRVDIVALRETKWCVQG